ncbi:cyclin-dependent kinase inhibitor 3-like [Scleropages formosus]|uniref:Cyclin-dependent kinase inhibitor 3 n=1 Tax=Scleropages formosus TaxID=113540 RepID=A0A0P7ZF65_SCLFO|nr:cyclin-dependent kinase inhibitor 3-like [Scleropages formosus]
MRTTEFDSSDEEDVGEEQQTPLQISWLPLSVVECSQFLGICPLPDELKDQGVEDVFVFCTLGELQKYRVPRLLDVYRQQGLRVHHLPFPDGGTPELDQCSRILEELQFNLENNRKTVIHCYGGLGRSGLMAGCLLLQLSVSMTPDKAIEILRELRGGGAIQTVKQYNFLHEFREKYAAYQENKEVLLERSVSR